MPRLGQLAVLAGLGLVLRAGAAAADSRPNFLIVVTDDQRYDTMNHATGGYMPQTYAFFNNDGTWFDQGYATTALCCPSRSSIFTGMYARHHGVTDNETVLEETIFPRRLRDAGYHTGLVGKYLNSQNGACKPQAFDYWAALENGGANSYTNYRLNVNCTWVPSGGAYMTDNLGNHAYTFLQSAPTNKPFLLYFAPFAPHGPATPAPQDAGLYAGLAPHRPPSFNEADVSDKPQWLRNNIPLWGAQRIADIDAFRLNQLRSLAAVDRQFARLIALLAAQNRLNNTVVIFVADNGFFWGEHRLEGKRRVYQEAIHVPMMLRYPPLGGRRVLSQLAANIDIAPTVYALAGIAQPPGVDGLSLVDLLQGRPWRSDLLIEAWAGTDSFGVNSPHFAALITGRFVYSQNDNQRDELYDLSTDYYQLSNHINNDGTVADPYYRGVRNQMRDRLASAYPCYVLTAAFGRPDHPVIRSLSDLHHAAVGRWTAPWHQAYLRWYDRVGPRIAAWVADTPWLRAVIRGAATLAERAARWWFERTAPSSPPAPDAWDDDGWYQAAGPS